MFPVLDNWTVIEGIRRANNGNTIEYMNKFTFFFLLFSELYAKGIRKEQDAGEL